MRLETQRSPAGEGEASRDKLGSWSQSLFSITACGSQFPILTAHCGAEWLAMMAAAAAGRLAL